jgi:hypothetical protein
LFICSHWNLEALWLGNHLEALCKQQLPRKMVARDTEYDPLILNGREDTMASRKDSFSPGLTVLPSQKKQKPSTAAEG